MLTWPELLYLLSQNDSVNKYAVCLNLAISYFYEISDITAQELAYQCGQLADVFCKYGEHELQFTFREFLLLHQSQSVVPTSIRSADGVDPELIHNLAEWLCGRPAGLPAVYESLTRQEHGRMIG